MTNDCSQKGDLLLLAIGLPGLETSIDSIGDLTQLLRSIQQPELVFIVLVGVPKALVEPLIEAGVAKQEEVLSGPSQSRGLVPGSICVVSDGLVPIIADGKLSVASATDEDRYPVDQFFKLVAQDGDLHAIGLLLHGKHSDGILGLRAICDSGGLTLVEAPRISDPTEHELSKQRMLMAGGNIDHFVGLSKLGTVINDYINHHLSVESDSTNNARRSVIESLSEISEILHQDTNHQFKNYKTSTLVRRIERRLKVNKLESVHDYVEMIRVNESERAALFRDLLISVTAFFRDPVYLEALKIKVLKRLIADHQQLRIWVAGCATGEEAFTLAILCDELRREMSRRCEIQVLATDIDTRALAVARNGDYPLGIESQMSRERLETYFVKKGGKYHVINPIREMCLFSVHNLISDPPFSNLHLITCRNVLIYLGTHLQIKLIPLFHLALSPGGYLLLGPAESLSGNHELFQEIDGQYRIWQRRTTAVDIKGQDALERAAQQQQNAPSAAQMTDDLKLLAQRIVLGEFSPEWVVIDEQLEVVAASDEIGNFLRIGDARLENHVVSLAKTGLKAGLRVTINESLKKRRRVDHDKLAIRVKGGIQRVRLAVQPMPRLGSEDTLLMVAFRKEGAVLTRHEFEAVSAQSDSDAIIEQLESDLAHTREDLARNFQELEAVNAKLQSANEKLLFMNEELQTANEKLESAKEELSTVNSQLLTAKNDLENLFQSSDIAMIFVDCDMNVKGFTDAAKNIYNLIDADVGRPLSHLSHKALEMPSYPTLDEITDESADHTVLVKTTSSQVFKRRVLPYVDRADGSLVGMLISFIDETQSIRNEYRARFAVEAGKMGVWTWNLRDRTIELDDFARQLLGIPSDEGNSWTSAWPIDEALARLAAEDRQRLEMEAFAANNERTDFSLDCQLFLPDGNIAWLTISGGTDPLELRSLTGVIFNVTERKLYYDQLQNSEAFNRAIVESSPDCVKIINRSGAVEAMNTNGCRLMEVDDFETIRGRLWWELWPENQLDLIKSAVESSGRGELVHFQAECPTARGKLLWWDVVVAGINNGKGEVERLIAVSRDITNSKQSEQLTAEFAEKLRAAMEVAEVGIATVEYQSDTVVCDPVAARIMRLRPGFPVTRKEFHDRFEATDRKRVLDAANQILIAESEKGFFAEARVPHENGMTWVNLRKRNFYNQSGIAVRGLIAIQDITDLRRTESELSEQHERLKQILTAAHAGTWELHVSEGTVTWSDESARLFGLEVDGRPIKLDTCLSRVHIDDRETVKRSIVKAFAENQSQWRCEYRIAEGGTIRWLYSSGTIQYDDNGRPIRMAGINIDISSQKLLEQELIAALDTAERATRVRGEFLANMSHEIRTPMTAILGHAEILAGQLREADDLQSLNAIRSNGKHLLDLINDILDLSKIDAGHLEINDDEVYPAELLADIRSLMDVRAAEKNLTLEFRFDTEIPEFIRTDELRLRQVLINLLGNAIKFTDKGSVLVNVRFDQADPTLYFRIEDTGIGIPEDLMPKLFDAFTQADSSTARRFEGTGLGLAISRRLTNAMGGEIRAESRPGFGSVFTVILPCKDAALRLIRPDLNAIRGTQSSKSETMRIDGVVLIVDDRRDIRLIAQHMVEKAGGRVVTAENGQLAVELLTRDDRADIDLVLMDMQMPVLDGYAATKELRRQGFSKPIIALTANAMKEDRDRCLEAGCDDYTSKPLDNRRLIELISRFLSRRP
jgi:two-component system, chemotaxis family, CheB/CheR fusion protein